MKKLGLVGGLGPESTLAYYRDIIHGVAARFAQPRVPELIVDSVDLYENLRILESGDLDAYAEWLMRPIDRLVAAGADFVAISSNTPHIVFDRVEPRCPVPLVSIVKTAADAALSRGYARVALMGTAFTMRGTFFREPFERAGIEVVVPRADEMDLIQHRLFDEVELGIVTPRTREEFARIAARMRDEQGAAALVLGCTELPLVFDDEATAPMPLLDTARIHVDALVDMIVS